MSTLSTPVIPGQYLLTTHKKNAETGEIDNYFPGHGCIVSQINTASDGPKPCIPVICATIVGTVHTQETVLETPSKSFVISVAPLGNVYTQSRKEFDSPQGAATASINLPQEKDVVLVKISKITNRQAHCEIVAVEGFGNVLADGGIGANGELAHALAPSGSGSQPFSGYLSIAASQLTFSSAVAADIGENFKGIIRSQDVRSTDRDKVKIIESFKPGDIVRAIIISLGDGSNYYLSTARNDLGVLFAKSENGAGDLMLPIDWQTMMDPRSGLLEKRKCAKPFVDEEVPVE